MEFSVRIGYLVRISMTESANIPLDVLRRIQATRARASDTLELAMSSCWNELLSLTPEERQRAGRKQIIQLLGAYASKIFDLEAQEYVALKLEPSELIRCLDELTARVQVHMIPPQFRINSFFDLGDLHYDDAYRSHILSAVQDRARHWKKGRVREREGCDSPLHIVDQYCKRERLTIAAFAKKARVDVSVIYALKAGRKKCGPDALARIASLVDCEPSQLLPDK
jgi:hypothetical protein